MRFVKVLVQHSANYTRFFGFEAIFRPTVLSDPFWLPTATAVPSAKAVTPLGGMYKMTDLTVITSIYPTRTQGRHTTMKVNPFDLFCSAASA